MSDSWDDYAEGWDTKDDVKCYAEKAFKSLTDVFSMEGARVLDFGCGTGLLTEKLSPLADEVVAIDSSPKMISVLNNKGLSNVIPIASELTDALISERGWNLNKFDFITASSVCGFLSDYESSLKRIKSVLVPGGVFIQWDWLLKNGNEGPGFTEKYLESALRNANFADISISKPFTMESPEKKMVVIMASGKNV